jgi:hypothetical protein
MGREIRTAFLRTNTPLAESDKFAVLSGQQDVVLNRMEIQISANLVALEAS